jgi:hypothetical protein
VANRKYKYDIAISFATEERDTAFVLALALKEVGFENVYYYPKKRSNGWGQDIKKTLAKIYTEEAKYAIVLFSNNYFDKEKSYTRIELEAIEKRMNADSNLTYMLPIIITEDFSFQNYPILQDLTFIEWNYNLKKIATELIEVFAIKAAKSSF